MNVIAISYHQSDNNSVEKLTCRLYKSHVILFKNGGHCEYSRQKSIYKKLLTWIFMFLCFIPVDNSTEKNL